MCTEWTFLGAVLGAVVGSFISGMVGFLLAKYQNKINRQDAIAKENRELDRKKKFFGEWLIMDLERSIDLYPRLKSDFEKTRTIYFEHTEEIKSSRRIYDNYPEHILQFGAKLRKDIFQYYCKTSSLLAFLVSNEQRKQQLELEYQRLFNQLKVENPTFDRVSIENIILQSKAHDMEEYVNCNKNLESKLNGLSDYINEAKDIAKSIRKEINT